MNTNIQTGDVVLVNLPVHQPRGHEQEGVRPVVIVSVPKGHLRYPVAIVVPVTSQIGFWASHNSSLYLQIPPGTGGLPKQSVILIDQIRAIDVNRITSYIGTLESQLLQNVRHGLIKLLTE